MSGYLVASQMIKYKHSGAHFKKKAGGSKNPLSCPFPICIPHASAEPLGAV